MNLSRYKLFVVMAAMLLCLSGQSWAQLNTPPFTFAVGTTPISLAVGDFHQDLNTATPPFMPDAAVANNGGNNVSIIRSTGVLGTTTCTTPAGACTSPRAIATADFNGDGWLDLVVVDTNNAITILINQQDASPTFKVLTQTHASGFDLNTPEGVAVGDFNKDGCPDLAVTNFGSNTVSILLNTKSGVLCTGQFVANIPATFPAGLYPSGIAVADIFDQCPANSIPPSPPTPCRAGAYVSTVGGPPLDLAIVNSLAGTVTILQGTGTGSFVTPPINTSVSFNSPFDLFCPGGFARILDEPLSIAIGDFNGDGYLDIVVAADSDSCTPTGSGAAIVLINVGAFAPGYFNAPVPYPADELPASVAIGDFNNDGILDLVVANAFSNDISVLFGNGDGTFLQPPLLLPTDYTVGSLPTAVVAFFNTNCPSSLPCDVGVANFGSNTVDVFTGN